jgi:cell division septation protein DedD
MFAFGILVGRGLPLVSSKDFSLRAEFIRFLGLGREVAPLPEDVATTWEDPKKMLEALDYYEDLTRKGTAGPSGTPAAPAPPKSEAPAVAAVAQKKAGAERSEQPQAQSAPAQNQAQSHASTENQSPPDTSKNSKPSLAIQPPPAQPVKAEEPKAAPKKAAPEVAAPDNGSEHFTLLIASLRDTERAQLLVDQLRSKGHTARLQALNLDGSGRWNRVLVGSFRNREEALRFSADFNRKERMEALVIREVQ